MPKQCDEKNCWCVDENGNRISDRMVSILDGNKLICEGN